MFSSVMQNQFRKLTDRSWLPKNHTWITASGEGYCTKCAVSRNKMVLKIRALPDDVCEGCFHPFAVPENT